MNTDFRPSRVDVKGAEAAAHLADERADCAGLLVADALLDGSSEIELLARNYRQAKVEAAWRWVGLRGHRHPQRTHVRLRDGAGRVRRLVRTRRDD